MAIVKEIYPDGHDGISNVRLEEMKTRANTLGFKVLSSIAGSDPIVNKIEVNDPSLRFEDRIFIALLTEA